MLLRALGALPLLLAGLRAASVEESGPGSSLAVPSGIQRRYSEATLASDYSRTMEHMLSKNFVEWLLARRERNSQDFVEPFKREAEPQKSAGNGENLDLGAKNFLEKLWKNREKLSFPGSEDLRELLEQEFLTWLCRASTE